jgi:RNA polymerase sigma-70 factor (ECF subfamily)
MDGEQFRALLAEVRSGNDEAAAVLVREFEPAIRRYIRVRLTDPRLRRLLDTMDICQSVLANFFVRAATGQFDIDQPEQLLRLLSAMARNRLLNHVRDEQAECRDNRRVQPGSDDALQAVADETAAPSEVAADKELLEEVRRRLSPEEHALLEQRAAGKNWAEVAAAAGANPDAVRKQLVRALSRIGRDLGLDHVDEN